MVLKCVYNPNQKALGLFVEGLPVTVMKPLTKEELAMLAVPDKSAVGSYRDYYSSRPDPSFFVLLGLKGLRILVCPTCKVDVEPDEVDGDKIVSVFCNCPKCGNHYFIVELIKDRHFRLKHPSDEGKKFYLHEDRGEFLAIDIDGFKEIVWADSFNSDG